MTFLLDKCVLSELRHPKGNQKVKDRIAQLEDNDLFISVITIGEIIKGITLLGQSPRKIGLFDWVTGLQQNFSDRILPVDLDTARIWGTFVAEARGRGKTIGVCDGLIAATAL